ncbi:site-specific recombinase, phage integrase family protein [Nitrobacter sp. Nb-311A]|nr:site-specific recombinase, phage integrase family protein [Nitrobacter sp. Nb-311A]
MALIAQMRFEFSVANMLHCTCRSISVRPHGRLPPYTAPGPRTAEWFGSTFDTAKIDGGMSERDSHFNDLQGTAATKFYVGGFRRARDGRNARVGKERAEKIIRRYVGRAAAIKAHIMKLEAKE